jgi:hypothetical protein
VSLLESLRVRELRRTELLSLIRGVQQASTSAVYGVWSFGRQGLGFQYKNGTEHRYAEWKDPTSSRSVAG